jgi:uncharacterized protein
VKVIRHHEPGAFSHRVMAMLMRDEAINNWMVGLLTDLCSGARSIPSEQLLLLEIQDDDGQAIAAAASTGEALVLTRMKPGELTALAAYLESENIVLPKTAGPADTVRIFASLWAERTGMKTVVRLQTLIMQLKDVATSYSVAGELRLAGAEDVELLTPWARGFSEELGMDVGNPHHDVRTRIERKRLYVWCNPGPVSMAALAGPTPNGIRINFVYTPMEFRRRGYARACVSSVTRKMLDAGKKFVFLFVDANNPATNRLYREIGYRPVSDWEDWRFETR